MMCRQIDSTLFFVSSSINVIMSSTSTTLTAATVGKAALATLVGLAAYYNDRAIFDENRKGIPYQPGLPLVGNLPLLIEHKDQIHDMFLEAYHRYNVLTL
jgi:fatty acid omega-hydroxylase